MLFAAVSCSPRAGSERGKCYGNGTCDQGLLCVSDLCVDPRTAKPSVSPATAIDRATLKSHTTEAAINVKRLFDGARSYYEEEYVESGTPKQFPRAPRVTPTPPPGTCCKSPGGLCKPDPSLWTDPSWKALKFSMDDPHRYSYYYRTEGTGAGAKFVVGALGDLDCDGDYSTFEMSGQALEGGTVSGQAGLFRNKELE